MNKISTINTRIEPSLKEDAEEILYKVGLSSSEAIRLFYKQVCLQNGLPFDVKMPNKTTVKAMRDADERKTFKARSITELLKE